MIKINDESNFNTSESNIYTSFIKNSYNDFISWFFSFDYYKIHLIFWLTCSLLGSIIIYISELVGSNNNISYINSLFLAASAMSVCGLTSINFENCNIFTQIIVLILFQIGSMIVMSIIPLVLRRYYYRKLYSEISGTVPDNTGTVPDNSGTVSNDGNDSEANNIFKNINVEQNIEYRALGLLMKIKIIYLVTCEILAFIMLILFFTLDSNISSYLKSKSINNVWAAIFFSVSITVNAGFSLFNTSFLYFRNNTALLMFSALFILLGYTCYPPVLRLIIYIYYKYIAKDVTQLAILNYILVNPRRCSTHLYPQYDSLFLISILLVLFVIQFILFISFEINNDKLLFPDIRELSGSEIALISFFQAISTRICGLQTVSLSRIHPSTAIMLMAMMYFSPYPIFFTMRRTSDEGFASIFVPEVQSGNMVVRHEVGNSNTVNIPDKSDPPKSLSNFNSTEFDEVQTDAIKDDEKVVDVHEPGSEVITAKQIPFLRSKSDTNLFFSSNEKKTTVKSVASFFRIQLKSIFLRDIFWVYFCYFFVASIEYSTTDYSLLFGLLFEILSAYGTVGLSMGDFSSTFHTASKLAFALLMIMGRHRGIPSSLDAAVDIKFKTEKMIIYPVGDQQYVSETDKQKIVSQLPKRIQNIVSTNKDFWWSSRNSNDTLHNLTMKPVYTKRKLSDSKILSELSNSLVNEESGSKVIDKSKTRNHDYISSISVYDDSNYELRTLSDIFQDPSLTYERETSGKGRDIENNDSSITITEDNNGNSISNLSPPRNRHVIIVGSLDNK